MFFYYFDHKNTQVTITVVVRTLDNESRIFLLQR